MNNSKATILILFLVMLALAGVLGAGSYSIWRNNHTTAQLLDEANATTRADVAAQAIKTMQNESSLELMAFDEFVLSDDKLVTLIERIEGAGQTFNLETNISSVNKIEDKKAQPTDPRLIRITIETDGGWKSTVSFLRALESLPYRVMMEEVNVMKLEDLWHMRVVLSLNSFD